MSSQDDAIRALDEVVRSSQVELAKHAWFQLRSLMGSAAATEMAEAVLGDAWTVASKIIRAGSGRFPTDPSETRTWLRRIIAIKALEYRRKRSRELRLVPIEDVDEILLRDHAAQERIELGEY